MSHGRPAKCVGMMARVRGPMRASAAVEVEVARAGLDVDEHRRGAHLDDHVGRGEERHRGGDHLVARARCRRCAARSPARRWPTTARAPVGRRTSSDSAASKRLHLGPAGDPARAQHRGDVGDGRLVERRAGEAEDGRSCDAVRRPSLRSVAGDQPHAEDDEADAEPARRRSPLRRRGSGRPPH